MRREFFAQKFSLFSRSLKSLLISTICKSYVYPSSGPCSLWHKLPGSDEAQVSAPSVLKDLTSLKVLLAVFTGKFKL